MFIGHYAVGLALKKTSPKISLGTLFLSVQFLDLLWPIFLLLGWEHVRIQPGSTAFTPLDFYDYPLSHSLLMSVVWGIVVGGVYYIFRRAWKESMILFIGVVSHWFLDLLVHRPDLPLSPWTSYRVGLGLWNSIPATILVEGAVFATGAFIYIRATKPRDRVGIYALWSLLAFLIVVWLLNIIGPPPPSVNALAIVSLALWLMIPWGNWIDRHRQLVGKILT
jgi:LexA-binding, inner membrane-associated putative hydrolase